MTTQLGHSRPGGRPNRSAAVQNTIMAATRRALTQDFGNPTVGTVRQEAYDPAIVSVVNNTAFTIDRYKSVGIGGIVFDPAVDLIAENSLFNQPTFEAVYPPTSADAGLFGVMLDTLEPGSIGLARVSGVVYALVESDVVVGDSVDISGSAIEPGALSVVSGGIATALWTGPITSVLPSYTQIALARIGGGKTGGRNSVINFTILDWFPAADPATFACDCVLAEVTRTSCATIAQVGDEVLVCDPNLCWFNLPIELLVGSRGRADWMSIDGVTATLECPTLLYQFGITDCLWICSDLCCREEIYA